MEPNFVQVVRKLVEAAWRRRVLLLTPLLLMLPLSIVAAKLLPKTYIATSLIAMQESDRDNPFASQQGQVDYTLNKRVDGLQAWLKSENILTGVLRQFTKTDPEAAPAAFMSELLALREDFKLSLVGNDFLEFSLQGSDPKRLGLMLDAIVSRFLEGLLMPDHTMRTASQMVLERQNQKLKDIRKQRAELEQRRDALLLQSARPAETKPQSAPGNLSDAAAPGASDRVRVTASIEQRTFADRNDGRGQTVVDAAIPNTTVPGLETPTEVKTSPELIAIETRIGHLDEDALNIERSMQQSALLKSSIQPESALGILSAPEGIRIIDAPKSPVKPAKSSLKIVLIGLLASVFLGLSLAVLGEMFDPRVYSPDQMASLCGTSILGRLPRSTRPQGFLSE